MTEKASLRTALARWRSWILVGAGALVVVVLGAGLAFASQSEDTTEPEDTPATTCPYYDPEQAQDHDQSRDEARDRLRECLPEGLRDQMQPMRDQMQERTGEMGPGHMGPGRMTGPSQMGWTESD